MQAKKLAGRISVENIQHVFASPYLRAIHTAHYCASLLHVRIKLEEGLGEMLRPPYFSGKACLEPVEERARLFPLIDTEYRSAVIPMYPESGGDLDDRCGRTIYRLLRKFEGNLLLVSHGASCISLVRSLSNCHLLNIDGHPWWYGQWQNDLMPLCSLSKVVENGEKWEVILHADTAHLTLA